MSAQELPLVATGSRSSTRSVGAALLPIMAIAFTAFLITGLAMPVLPLHIHLGLGLDTTVVGAVAGSQFAAALGSRLWAGHYADTRGAKRATVVGLLGAAAAGLLYLLSLRFVETPALSVAILLLGRALLGGAESFMITSAVSWGLARVGRDRTGTAIAWIGAAMWGAFAIGAPLGSALYAGAGFAVIAVATTLLPLATLLLVAALRPDVPQARGRVALARVLRAVWLPGSGMALACLAYGGLTTFVTLLFSARGWSPEWPGVTAFAGAFIAARVLFGQLADRIGGSRVALVFTIVEAAGLALIWLAPSAAFAIVGAALAGFGWSLVYPGFGQEAVRRAPPESRGLATGAYTAFLDLALGVTSPALGLVASWAGIGAVFQVSGLVVLGAAGIALRLLQSSVPRD
jgi:MFS family permease